MLYDRNATSDGKGRLYYFDNAKFILIFLVVLAHALSPLKDPKAYGDTLGANGDLPALLVRALWSVINYFHMPALIFISGFFAKRYISKSREIKVQRVATYVILYLAAQVAVSAFERYVLKVPFSPSFMQARSSLWFLQCLITWYVMLPVLDYFKPGAVMALSVLFGLIIGYEKNAGDFLAISRAFVHLPFFMAGYYIKQEHIEKLFKRKFRWIALAIFAAVAAVCLIKPQTAISALITCNTPYYKIPALAAVPRELWWLSRLWFYGIAAALIVAFLALVPRGKAAFTGLGKETLSVYILHRFLYLAHLKYQWYLPFASPGGIALLSLIALALTVIFSLKPFTLPFHWLQRIQVRLKGRPDLTT